MIESRIKAEEITGRTSKAVKNIAFNIINQVVLLILSFISRTVFIHYLGIEYLGINSLFSDILGLLSMADLGLNTAMVYSFYRPLAEHDEKKISALVTFYRKIYIVIALIITILGIALVPFLPHIINLSNSVANLTLYYLISLSNIVCSYLFIYKTSLLIADQKNYVVVRVTIIANILRTLFQITVLILFKNYTAYLIIATVATVVSNIVSSRIASKCYKFVDNRNVLPGEEKKKIFSNIVSVFIYKVSSMLLNATDNLLISMIVGTIAVGYYANYLLVQNKIISVYSLIFTSVTASIGNLIVTENESRRYQIFQGEQTMSFILSCIIVPCFTALINDFILIWVGKEFLFDFFTVLTMALNLYLSCVLQPLWSYREATGLYKQTKWLMTVCALINLILSIMFGKIWGVAGIIFASSISRLLTYFWYEPKLLYRQYFNRKAFTYFRDLLKNFVLVVILVFVSYKIGKYVSGSSIIRFLQKTVIVLIINIVSAILIYSKSVGAKIIKNKIVGYMNKNVKNKNFVNNKW